MDLGRKSKVAGTRRDQSGPGVVCQVVGGAQISRLGSKRQNQIETLVYGLPSQKEPLS